MGTDLTIFYSQIFWAFNDHRPSWSQLTSCRCMLGDLMFISQETVPGDGSPSLCLMLVSWPWYFHYNIHYLSTMLFVSSCLDAENAQGQLQCIRRTQNTATRIITNSRRYEYITPVLRQLHWLPIQEWIEFKVLCLTYKALHNMAPLYLTPFLSQKIGPRQLRCKDQHLLQVLLTSLTYAGDRSFEKAAPMLYNALPVTIKQLIL